MAASPIEYIKPTSRALGRMTTILFRPFDIGKWFVLGFSAWLATLMDGGNSSSGNINGGDFGGAEEGDEDGESFEEIFEPVRIFIAENISWIIPAAIALIVVVLLISVIFLWLSSRGKFMFLDNVIYNRALVQKPWREFKVVGNSLFKWRLVFGAVIFLLLGSLIAGSAYYLISTFDEQNITPLWIAVIVISGGILFLSILILSYVMMLLEDFVIPLMYRDGISTVLAWRQFFVIHKKQKSRFVLFFLWRALLGMMAAIIMFVVILITCCIAGIFLMIPYVGAVLLLPVTVFFRALGPEFLRQFGDDQDLWYGEMEAYGFGPPKLPELEA